MPIRRQSPWSDWGVNYDLFKLINNASGNSFLDALMKDVAKYAIAISFLVVAVLCLLRLLNRQIWPIVWSAVGLVLTFLLGLVAAAAYKEKRPFQTHHVHQLLGHSPGQSFPSDHATAAFGCALVALVLLSRAWGVVLVLLGVFIGFARVYLGIHYPGDIGGSFLCAVVGVAAAWGLSRLFTPTARVRTTETVTPAPAQ
jgi:undecaprenyl-diphosphatase